MMTSNRAAALVAAVLLTGAHAFLSPFSAAWTPRSRLGRPATTQLPAWGRLHGATCLAGTALSDDGDEYCDDARPAGAAETAESGRVSITYCARCNWMLRSSWLAQELLSTFKHNLTEVALKPRYSEPGGDFLVYCDGELVWDRRADGGFPEAKQLKQRVRDVISPAMDLGHSDVKGKAGAEAEPEPEPEAKVAVRKAAPGTPGSGGGGGNGGGGGRSFLTGGALSPEPEMAVRKAAPGTPGSGGGGGGGGRSFLTGGALPGATGGGGGDGDDLEAVAVRRPSAGTPGNKPDGGDGGGRSFLTGGALPSAPPSAQPLPPPPAESTGATDVSQTTGRKRTRAAAAWLANRVEETGGEDGGECDDEQGEEEGLSEDKEEEEGGGEGGGTDAKLKFLQDNASSLLQMMGAGGPGYKEAAAAAAAAGLDDEEVASLLSVFGGDGAVEAAGLEGTERGGASGGSEKKEVDWEQVAAMEEAEERGRAMDRDEAWADKPLDEAVEKKRGTCDFL